LFIPTALASGNDWANTLRSQGQLLQRSREFFEKLHSKVHALIHTYICKRIQDELVNERNRLLGFAFQIERHPGDCCRKRIALFKVKVNLITWEQNQESSSSTYCRNLSKRNVSYVAIKRGLLELLLIIQAQEMKNWTE
jgi:hypothetical protein